MVGEGRGRKHSELQLYKVNGKLLKGLSVRNCSFALKNYSGCSVGNRMEMNKIKYPTGGCGIIQAGGGGGPSYEKASGDEESGWV